MLDPVGMQQSRALRAELSRGSVGLQAVGVDPGFQRKALGMGGFYQHGKRGKTGVLPLGAGAKVAERKIPAGVQGISKGPHMGKNGVCPKGGNVLHDGGGIGTESGFTAEIGMLPFQKADPDGANLLRGSRGWSGCSGKHRACGWLRRGRRPQYGGHYEKK